MDKTKTTYTLELSAAELRGLCIVAGEGAEGLFTDAEAAKGYIGNKRAIAAAQAAFAKLEALHGRALRDEQASTVIGEALAGFEKRFTLYGQPATFYFLSRDDGFEIGFLRPSGRGSRRQRQQLSWAESPAEALQTAERVAPKFGLEG